jgi:hypothetical protein
VLLMQKVDEVSVEVTSDAAHAHDGCGVAEVGNAGGIVGEGCSSSLR